MYEEYIKSERTLAEKVLKYILKKARLTRKQFSKKAGIYQQRISDLIKGTCKNTDISKFSSALFRDTRIEKIN